MDATPTTPTKPSASLEDLKVQRSKVDILSFLLTGTAIGFGVLGYNAPAQILEYIGLTGMVSFAFAATYNVDKGDALSTRIRALTPRKSATIKHLHAQRPTEAA
ncbi:hypothetical protein ACQCLI_31950 (plasmid) [Pseudomonas nitroreducens]|uniref:hypothetical protein n=1 Tax=Pseudomonas nitroreducens TaxID=46680 RepID=UPI00030E6210|nr:hypothetical protein [Pseudomonas nitroreducens]MBF3053143.1 hypothetical protein [Pseudomonas aeruginosa]